MARDLRDLVAMGLCNLLPNCVARRVGCNALTSTALVYRLLHR